MKLEIYRFEQKMPESNNPRYIAPKTAVASIWPSTKDAVPSTREVGALMSTRFETYLFVYTNRKLRK